MIRDVLITVQYITIIILFIEILIVFLGWKNSIHSNLLLTCLVSFVSNMGYLFEMQAESEGAFIVALKLSYLGRIWICLAFFLFAAKMCRIKLPKGIISSLVLVHVIMYISVMTFERHELYYKSYQFVFDSMLPRFYHANGPMHDLFIALNFLYAVMGMRWLVKSYLREKNKVSRRRFLMLIMAFSVQVLMLLLQVTAFFEISKYYDLTMMGALCGNIFFLIGIFRFDLLGAREIAKEFVVDRISEGIIVVDNDGRIQYYNEPVTKLYPEFDAFYTMKALGANLSGTPYDIVSQIQEAVRAGQTLTINGRIYSPEENDLQYNGESYGTLYALVDSTEHFQYMEELQKQRDIADSANEAKSRFLANMSHEIRTPINAVLGMDEMILRESNEKEIRGYAANIMSAGRTLLSLINDILDLSKVEEGRMEIIPVQYDLSSLIYDLVNMIRERAAKKGLKLIVKVDGKVPHLLLGDEIRIRQCVMNILTNAVKYTEKGEVRLLVSYEKAQEGHISLSFSVEDTGIGMKAEDMENLFSPYKRIEEKRNRTIEGTGLGMSITRQLLDLMGSSLDVKSEYGKGSVFSFAIDQEVVKWEEIGDITARLEDSKEATREYHELFHAPEASILVVDDTEMNITVIQSLLKKTGIRIDSAQSGREAIDLAGKKSYDVIFIDHMMPEMDGIETRQHICREGKNQSTPMVALTANAVSGARQMYLEAGFNDCLFKPVDGEKLEKMLLRMLPESKVREPDESIIYEEETESGLTDFIKGIEEIDYDTGLANCGSEKGYLNVISVFSNTAAYKADEIEELYNSGDIDNYTIKVHALKSSARIIGAATLSDMAKKLEDAGKSGDMGFIKENTDPLLKDYRKLGERLGQAQGPEKDLPAVSDKAMKEAYQTITEIAGSMDYGLMEELLGDLKKHTLSEDDRLRISEIEKKLMELDWESIIRIGEEGYEGKST